MACCAAFPGGNMILGDVHEDIAQYMYDFKVQGLGAFAQADKVQIIGWLSEHPISGKEDQIRLEQRVQHWSMGPLLRAAAARDDSATVEKICKSPGLSVNSRLLVGCHGENALHVAAAAGSSAALQRLLAANMDPNIGDGVDERPLHYAAMAGQAEAVKLLLDARADNRCESRFGETALDVAKLGGASFLSVEILAGI